MSDNLPDYQTFTEAVQVQKTRVQLQSPPISG